MRIKCSGHDKVYSQYRNLLSLVDCDAADLWSKFISISSVYYGYKCMGASTWIEVCGYKYSVG